MVYDYLFTSQFQIWIFCYTFTYFVPSGVIKNRVTKVNFKYFNGNFAEVLLFEKFTFELDSSSHSFKITCILSGQVISLKKMVVQPYQPSRISRETHAFLRTSIVTHAFWKFGKFHAFWIHCVKNGPSCSKWRRSFESAEITL